MLDGVVKNDAYINPKLTTWEGKFKTNFHGVEIPFNYGIDRKLLLKIRMFTNKAENIVRRFL